ncbi:hypothetical protein LguiB_001052 [Lonicera macranthoides]
MMKILALSKAIPRKMMMNSEQEDDSKDLELKSLIGDESRAALKNNEEFNGRPIICSVFEEPNYKNFEGVVVTVENFSFTGFDETRESLKKKFEHCGAIKDVFLPKDENGPGQKGKAFIAFENKGALAQALSVKSQGLKIREARGYPQTLNQCGYEGGYGGIYGYPFATDKKKKRQI